VNKFLLKILKQIKSTTFFEHKLLYKKFHFHFVFPALVCGRYTIEGSVKLSQIIFLLSKEEKKMHIEVTSL